MVWLTRLSFLPPDLRGVAGTGNSAAITFSDTLPSSSVCDPSRAYSPAPELNGGITMVRVVAKSGHHRTRSCGA